MSYFDNDPRIADFSQPLITVPIPFGGRIINLGIDFLIQYKDDIRTDLIHVQRIYDEPPLPACKKGIPKIYGLEGMIVLRIDRKGIQYVDSSPWQ